MIAHDPTAITDWRAIAASETANAAESDRLAEAAFTQARKCDAVGDAPATAYWLDLGWAARDMAIEHRLAARVALAEVTAIRERCAPRERAMLVRLAVCPAVAS